MGSPERFLHINDVPPEKAAEIAAAVQVVRTDERYPDPVLLAIGGSYAYGLAHAASDIDVRGVYVSPVEAFVGLESPPSRPVSRVDPDAVMYELGVFMRLALASNPNIVELLWLDRYEHLDPVGQALVDGRSQLVSQLARTTYIGFATSQLKEAVSHLRRIEADDEDIRPRMVKHLRHTFRILDQGISLLGTGEVQVRVSNPAELFRHVDLSEEELLERFEEKRTQLDTMESQLPERPDREAANELLLELRRQARSLEL